MTFSFPSGRKLLAASHPAKPSLVIEPPEANITRGVYVALEGWESAGKTTQTALLAKLLTSKGYDVVTTREPGATPLGTKLRKMLLESKKLPLGRQAEMLLFAADNAQHVHEVVIPALKEGCVVLTDRSLGSALAYQGAGRQRPHHEVKALYMWATSGVVPDLTLCLHRPWAEAVKFFRSRTQKIDRIESEPTDFHKRVHNAYKVMSATEPNWVQVAADGTRKEVTNRLADILLPFIESHSAVCGRSLKTG